MTGGLDMFITISFSKKKYCRNSQKLAENSLFRNLKKKGCITEKELK